MTESGRHVCGLRCHCLPVIRMGMAAAGRLRDRLPETPPYENALADVVADGTQKGERRARPFRRALS